MATAPQTISSLTNYTFVIDDASTNLTLNYTFIAGNDTTSFYTPLILGDVTFEAWSSAVADTTSPTWSLNQTNSTINGSSTLFSLYWDDDTALEDLGQYIFSTNNTGIWANESAVNFTSTPEWANVTLTLNDTVGISIGWRMYVDDNAGNVNNTGVFSLTTTSAVADTCTCPGAGNSWEIDMEDYCNLTESCNLTTGNVTWIGSSGYFNCSAEFKLTNRDAPPSATIFYFSSGCNLIHLIIGLMFFIKRRKYEIGTI